MVNAQVKVLAACSHRTTFPFFWKGFVCVSFNLIYSLVILRVLSWKLTTDVGLIYTPLSRHRSTTAVTSFVDIIHIIIIIIIILPLWIKAAGLLQMKTTSQNWTLKGKWQIIESHQCLAGQHGHTHGLFNAHKHMFISFSLYDAVQSNWGFTRR